MEHELLQFLSRYGYLTLVAVGFAEYAGAPVASVPVLVTAGGLGPLAGLNPVLTVACVALGGLLADLGWFLLVRWRGEALVDAACGLTSNPNACVLGVQERVSRLGPAYVIPAKFIPGAGNLVSAGAALAGMQVHRFLALDTVSLLLWAGAWTSLGRFFSGEVRAVLERTADYRGWALAAAVGLVVAAAAWRGARVLLHRRGHAEEQGGG